ncbi:hypothetical protein GPAL_1719 [Glaciecola pallidula DSM 14239 = ACAM 615]|jgi:hypothetical protein|uniref:Uncharacterized protein n=1 Tax=Brumicola pallidula DSM 14239 = ACAM 615 TaxID=1121922 RepID=K6ZE10_9ALTE|nr:hypothetical protein GPAL_1719 [Glaciecola pallidula DSM 14239 = ACAM 615]
MIKGFRTTTKSISSDLNFNFNQTLEVKFKAIEMDKNNK